ncbi:MAG: efflux RND transporter permease subunit [Chromatocurvus sp.]
MIAALLSRPRLVALIATMLALLGVASYLGMARQEDPSFPYRSGLITVNYPGALAEAQARLVLDPLSEELLQVEEIDDFTATARTGVALVSISLQDAIYDTDAAWDRVRQAMERARREFPDAVGDMVLDDRQIDIPAIVLAVSGDASLLHLTGAAERLKRALINLPGLSRIELAGDADAQITIALRDPELRRLGLQPDTIGSLLSTRNQVMPGGFIVAGDRRIGVLPNSEFTSIDELAATQVALPGGGSVPLSAIAEIWRSPQEPEQPRAWHDGEQTVLVALTPQRGQIDAIRFGESLRERVEQLRADFAPLVIDEMFFQPDHVEDRLDSLLLSLVGSMLIIVLVILLGMGWRMGLLVASMLPLVALISLGLYNLGGGILHQIAVIGVVISLGILIDNAIVMTENIQDRLNRGSDRRSALRGAVRELAGPLGASTGTTLAAFLPLLLARGGTGDFTRGIPIMIMLTLSVSYLLAISVAPLLAGAFLRVSPVAGEPRVERLGRALGTFSARHPLPVMAAGVILVVCSIALLPWLKLQFFPNADRPQAVIELFLPEGTDQAHTAAVAADLERDLRQRPEVTSIHRFAGSAGPPFYYNLPRAPRAPNRGRLVVNTTSLGEAETLIAWVRDHVARTRPELDIAASTLGQGPPRVAPVEVRLYHPDEQRRIAAAEQVFDLLKRSPGAVDVRHDIDLGAPTLKVNVDDARAAAFGLSRSSVARALFRRNQGSTVEQYRQERDPIPIVLRSPEGSRQSVDALLSTQVFSADGTGVPLTALAATAVDWLPASIRQRNGAALFSVTANLASGASFSDVLAVLDAGLAADPLPAGTRLEYGGDAEGSGDANQAIATMAPTGLLLLLFFLVLQFNSFRRVGIVLLTVPLAAVGVLPGLVFSGSPFGFQSTLGVIALVGIVLNNAIVLLDVVDQRLAQGAVISDAIIDAVQRRTRPILLTTATTIAGLLPLAFSASTLWPPMAWAIISGLLASTVMTLLVIPAVTRLCLRGARA